MKLNVGCGKRKLEGWTNIDVAVMPGSDVVPDVFADARDIPLPDGCADELMAIHLFEHFYIWEIPGLLAEWSRLLKSGGKLVLEMPDIKKCAQNLLNGDTDQFHMWGFYGDPELKEPLMCHKWGWCPETLKKTLIEHGFVNCAEETPEYHRPGRYKRDLRMIAIKK